MSLIRHLTPGELETLRNLGRKHGGESVPFVNIRDARTLTDLGLANRSREGWDITPAGLAVLSGEVDDPG
ncbi:MAG: hypothetical protein JWQ97_4049 [Phenylobacterium sp.]|nr:hypothetical protein [Phenylobacterium sp.]